MLTNVTGTSSDEDTLTKKSEMRYEGGKKKPYSKGMFFGGRHVVKTGGGRKYL